MSYQRIQTPRIYTDNINWLMSLGRIEAKVGALASGNHFQTNLDTANDFTQGSVMELFDMKLSNVVKIGSHNSTALTSSSSAIYFDVDTSITTDSAQDMNHLFFTHNLEECGAKFRVIVSDSSTFASGNTIPTMTEVVNASVSGGWATPANNGWSLITWADTTGNANQYVRLEIDSVSGNYDNATMQLSSIQMGEYFTFSHSPDMNIKKSIQYDGVKRHQSIGGHTYATSSHIRPPNWIVEPWHTPGTPATPNEYGRSGRLHLDMNFSYISDSDVFPSEFYDRADIASGNDITSNLVFRTNGGMFPFLFQFDKDTAVQKDSFMWCRLNSEPTFSQVAHQVWNCGISLVEEY